MKITSHFSEPENLQLKNNRSSLRNIEPLIGELEFWDSLEDPFIDKLVRKMENTNRFDNCFDVEVF